MSDFARQLKRVIVRSGMSPTAIAWKAGCSRHTIDNWLCGRNEPSLRVAIKVAKVLGKSLALTDGEALLVDTPASVAAKMAGAREFIGLWRRYQ